MSRSQVYITHNSQTLQLSEVGSLKEMLTLAYRMHIEPLEILSYQLVLEDQNIEVHSDQQLIDWCLNQQARAEIKMKLQRRPNQTNQATSNEVKSLQQQL